MDKTAKKGRVAYPKKEYTKFRLDDKPQQQKKSKPTKHHNKRFQKKDFSKEEEVKFYEGPGNKLRIIVLGGLEEIGRNMSMIEYDDEIIIIDMGLQFPEEDQPGIDYIVPNISYFRGKEKNIKGVVITHGHYDHIGAIPHLMPKLGNPPMYAGKLAAGMIQKRHEDFPTAPPLNMTTYDEGSRLKIGKHFEVEFVEVNHNIPDTYAIIIHTPVGTIMHTGDFKIDQTPSASKPVDIERFKKIGDKGVLALMADSTNATQKGHQVSEVDVERDLEKIFIEAKGRIIIGTFASLVTRVQQIITLAEKYNRRIYLQGRSMLNNVDIAHKLGYLKFKKGTIVEQNEFKKVPDKRMVVIGTGAQGERNAVMMRIANDEHRDIHLKEGDTIIFSSSVIPGNERTVQKLKDTFTRKGAKVFHYQMMDVHAGGHARAEDLKYFINLVRPKYYIPIEAHHYMLRANADLAEEVGINPKNIFVGDNGQAFEFTKRSGKLTDLRVPADYVFVDGIGVTQSNNVVLRDRLMLSSDGIFVVIVTVDAKTGKLIGSPDIISRGFIYLKENKELLDQSRSKIKKILANHDKKSPAFESYIKEKIKNSVAEYLYAKTKKRPMVLPVIIEV